MSELTPKKEQSVVPLPQPARWEHPDLRVSSMVVRAASLGHPAERIAEIIGMDIKTLKRHYSYELSSGKDALALRIHEVGVERALQGDQKMVQFFLKYLTDMNDFALEAKYKKSADPENEDKGEEVEDLSGLTTDEIKAYYLIKQKMKKPIDVKAKVVSEPEA